MKKILVIILAATCTAALAQKVNSSAVPAPVRLSFTKNFQSAKNVHWEKEKGDFEANFSQDGHKMSATYDAMGTLKETEKPISIAKLPKPVVDYIQKKYKKAKIREASEITLPDGVINYETNVGGKDLIFDSNGSFIRSQAE